MGRIIINHGEDVGEERAMRLVSRVIEGGRISGSSFCYISIFQDVDTGEEVIISAGHRGSGTDTFKLWVNASQDPRMVLARPRTPAKGLSEVADAAIHEA